MSILLKNIKYLDINSELIKEDDIYLEDGIIKEIGVFTGNKENIKIINGQNKLLIPGIFNAHTHTPMTILRNYSDDKKLKSWLNDDIWPAESKFTEDDIYWGSILGMAELLKFGITSFIDMYFYIDKIGEALEDSKMRGFISRGLIGNDDPTYEQIRETENFIQKWDGKGNGRINGMVGPHAPYTCSTKYLEKALELAQKYKKSIHIHLAESDNEVRDSLKKYGLSPVEYLEKIGIYKVNTLAAHCVKLTEKDIDILSENNVNILYNPVSNMKLGNGFARIKDLKEKNINICLGTDGCASNNNLSIIEEMKIASVINKGLQNDPTFLSPIEILKMVTINGAKAVQMENKLGTIEVNKKADLTIINLDRIQTTPENNLVSSLVYSVQSDNIYSTIVDGEILFENGEFYTIDIEKAKFNVKNIAKKISSK